MPGRESSLLKKDMLARKQEAERAKAEVEKVDCCCCWWW
jgi:hypothetical protein